MWASLRTARKPVIPAPTLTETKVPRIWTSTLSFGARGRAMTMAVFVSVRSYTHATTHVADNILRSLKNILVYSGLDPDKLAWIPTRRYWANTGRVRGGRSC